MIDLFSLLPVLRAVLPHILSPYREYLTLPVRVLELEAALNEMRKAEKLNLNKISLSSLCSDPEALLKSASESCPEKYRSVIDGILGALQAQKFYSMYNDLSEVMSTFTPNSSENESEEAKAASPDELCADSTSNKAHGPMPGTDIIEALSSLLSPEEKQNLELLKELYGGKHE